MITLIILIIIWSLLGVSGVIFWWTSEYDFTKRELPLLLCGILGGPLCWIIGYFIHRKPVVTIKKTLFKKRN